MSNVQINWRRTILGVESWEWASQNPVSKSQVGLTKTSPSTGLPNSLLIEPQPFIYLQKEVVTTNGPNSISANENQILKKKEMDFEFCLSLIIVCTFRRVLFSLFLWSLAFRSEAISSFIHGFEADLEGAQGPPERPSYLLQCWYHLLRQIPHLLFCLSLRCLFVRVSLVSIVVSFFPGSICDLSNFWESGLYFLINMYFLLYMWFISRIYF